MTDEMENCIRDMSKTLHDIHNVLEVDMLPLFKRIADEGVSVKEPEPLKVEVLSSVGDVIASSDVPSSEGRNEKGSDTPYRTGDLLIPGNLDELPVLEAAIGRFVAPATIDLRDYCVMTRDQGGNPWCAAYSATSFKSNIFWRKTDVPEIFEAEPVYSWAKQHDGSPKASGTTLNAALQALLEDGSFDKDRCSVKMLRNINHIKYAIHKFGCCLVGLDVTEEWVMCNKSKSTISGSRKYSRMGGHAVLACGYNRDGLIIQNSWGLDWGAYGFALITWTEFEDEFMYGAVIDNCLYDTRMN